LLSIIDKGSATGKVFGLHEFFDQVEAIVGPLIMSLAMLYTTNNYQLSFILMFIPYIVLQNGENHKHREKSGKCLGGLGFRFKTYAVAVFFNTFGLIPASLILYKVSILLSAPTPFQNCLERLFSS
jgi:hypothetical protein